MQYKNIAATTITNRTTDIMMKKFLMLYAFLMTALSLFAREDRVSNFEQLMRLPRIAETDMVSYPGGKCMMYRLYLRDKDLSHTPFSVSRPADFQMCIRDRSSVFMIASTEVPNTSTPYSLSTPLR